MPGRVRRHGGERRGRSAGSAAFFAVAGFTLAKGYGLCGWGHPNCKVSPAYNIVGYGAIDVAGALRALWLYRWLDLTPDKLPAKWLVIGGSAAVAAGAVLYAVAGTSPCRANRQPGAIASRCPSARIGPNRRQVGKRSDIWNKRGMGPKENRCRYIRIGRREADPRKQPRDRNRLARVSAR
jgi:hypothetical protein